MTVAYKFCSTDQFTYIKSSLTFVSEASDLELNGFPENIILTSTKTLEQTLWCFDSVINEEDEMFVGAIYRPAVGAEYKHPKLRGHTLRIYND